MLACSFLMLFSMAGVNAAEDDSSDGIIINDTNVTQEDNPLQSDDNDSTDNGTEDTGDQTDTITYQTSAEGFSGSVTVEEVETAASELKNYVEIHNSLPDTIQVGSYTLTMSEFLKILLMTVINLDQNVSTPVAVTEVGDAPNPAGQNISGNIQKSEYVKKATSILNFMNSNDRAPNYSTTSLGNLRYEYIVFNFAKIMDFHKYYNRLPNYTVVQTSAMSYQMMEISSKYGAKNVIVTDSYVQCSGRCTCSLYQDYDYHTAKFVNYCPYCHKSSTLDYEEGNTIYDNPEGMWVCSMSKGGCDADFCLVHGKAHVTSGAKYLTSA